MDNKQSKPLKIMKINNKKFTKNNDYNENIKNNAKLQNMIKKLYEKEWHIAEKFHIDNLGCF